MTEVRELTEKEYNGTMSGGMKNVTESAEFITDIWEYARNFSVGCCSRNTGLKTSLLKLFTKTAQRSISTYFFSATEKMCMLLLLLM